MASGFQLTFEGFRRPAPPLNAFLKENLAHCLIAQHGVATTRDHAKHASSLPWGALSPLEIVGMKNLQMTPRGHHAGPLHDTDPGAIASNPAGTGVKGFSGHFIDTYKFDGASDTGLFRTFAWGMARSSVRPLHGIRSPILRRGHELFPARIRFLRSVQHLHVAAFRASRGESAKTAAFGLPCKRPHGQRDGGTPQHAQRDSDRMPTNTLRLLPRFVPAIGANPPGQACASGHKRTSLKHLRRHLILPGRPRPGVERKRRAALSGRHFDADGRPPRPDHPPRGKTVARPRRPFDLKHRLRPRQKCAVVPRHKARPKITPHDRQNKIPRTRQKTAMTGKPACPTPLPGFKPRQHHRTAKTIGLGRPVQTRIRPGHLDLHRLARNAAHGVVDKIHLDTPPVYPRRPYVKRRRRFHPNRLSPCNFAFTERHQTE